MRSVKRTILLTLTCVFFSASSAIAVRQLVTIDTPQPARRVEGIVLDPSGAPIPEMTVSDYSEGWAIVVRTTKTDDKGHFRFSEQRGKNIYYLQFDSPSYNPLRIKLKLDKNSPHRAVTVNAPIGG